MKRIIYSFICIMMFTAVLFNGTQPSYVKAASTVKIDSKLSEVLETATDPIQVIVTFEGNGAPTSEQLNLLKGHDISTGVTMKSLPIAGVLATKEQINKLATEDGVKSLYLNSQLNYFNYDANQLTGVDKARTDDEMKKANGGFPVSGKGVGVVVNDSGVDGTHKDHELGKNLVQNVMGSTNLNSFAPELLPITYTENVPNTDTNSGHGTHVAGTVGGTGASSGGKYEGAAPGADLVGYGSGAALFVLDGIGGFDYAITHQTQYNIRVITNSWGSSEDFDPNHPINVASKAAYDRGITVLFAAGNEGPGEDTHNPYAKAPWVISVAAGEKDGKLAGFSSRGTKDVGGTFELDGKTWTWEDRPALTAPGVDIISTRVIAPVSSLGATADVEMIEPAFLPFYTTMSGTSMATPHVAGVVALLLEAQPNLSPDEIKQVLQETATNMPGYETWEAGTGYLNAYAALDSVMFGNLYGSTLNNNQEFNSNVDTTNEKTSFEVAYNPATLDSNSSTFQVEEGIAQLTAKVNGKGVLEETGNPINLVLIAPDGTEYSSGVSLLFPLNTDRTVSVNSPKSGEWKSEIRGLRGDEANPVGIALPETVKGSLTLSKVSGFTGLSDIEGHAAGSAIKMAVNERLIDGYADGSFKPNQNLVRNELARSLVMGTGIRQSQAAAPKDVKSSDVPFIQAVVSKGASIRDIGYSKNGVMQLNSTGQFNPSGEVNRTELAYSLVQALGLEKEAREHTGEVTVLYNDERITINDSGTISQAMKGYVQVALNLNILNATFNVEQGPYDLEPTIQAIFKPETNVTRGDYAVAASRYYEAWFAH
ncbi:S8 family serine peptidase [Paenisporosarcina sp. TG-14]|uniref:S8 family serine peptidase n=1 Tax=Paenisporosarcina sp. TG-14 TaxID=1231057 RepID=UPI00037AB82D|nr:S8 family serine peptidase [Paenisporosarcina sp. TG-14]